MEIKIKNNQYEGITLVVDYMSVRIPEKTEITIETSVITDQMKELEKRKRITIKK